MAVSNTAEIFSSLFSLFVYLAIIVGGVVFGIMAYLIIKYREKDVSAPEPEDAPKLGKLPPTRGKLKMLMTSLSLSTIILIVLIIGVPGVISGTFEAIDRLETPPQGTLTINVIGTRFFWTFVYPNGHQDGLLRVPVDEVIILKITSSDVFHNFGIIEFKLKKDAIPGQINTLWFNDTEVGEYTIQCFEFCGVGHAFMRTQLIVMNQEDFQSWYSSVG